MKYIVIVFSFFLCGCSSLRIIHHQTNDTDSIDFFHDHYIIYSDSINDIIRSAKTTRFYKMAPLVRDTTRACPKDSLLNFPILKKLGKLSRKEKYLVDFVIDDGSLYELDYQAIRQPFNPDYIIEYKHKGHIAHCLISFGSGEIAIADKNKILIIYHMHNSYFIERCCNFITLNRTK